MSVAPGDVGTTIDRPPKAQTRDDEFWEPALNPTQKLAYDDPRKYLLGYGEKGSGKSHTYIHKSVRHSYEANNGLCIVISPVIFTGAMGFWASLESDVLPTWRDGNQYPRWTMDGKPHPYAGQLMDDGIGLEFTEGKLDALTKDRSLYVKNMHGSYSQMMLKSIPHGRLVRQRMFGPTPSMICLEELTDCGSVDYLTYTAVQLGRKKDSRVVNQWTASCNPSGPSHWVYKWFWDTAMADKLNGIRKPDYGVYHFPIGENRQHIDPDYYRSLQELFSNDPTAEARYMRGLWVDAPSGEAMFKDSFLPKIHVRGDAYMGYGLMPVKGLPIIIGYDPGPANFCVSMLQLVPMRGKNLWMVFDELNFVGRRMTYRTIVKCIVERMNFWRTHYKCGDKYVFQHIADEAAFNQRRSDGSFENQEIQKHFRELGEDVVMFAAPKGNESVAARGWKVDQLLQTDEILFSATCIESVKSMTMLEPDKPRSGKYDVMARFQRKKSIYAHQYDSFTYPIHYYSSQGTAPLLSPRTGDVGTRIYRAR